MAVIGGETGSFGVCEATEGSALDLRLFGSKPAAAAMHRHVGNEKKE